MDDIKNKIEAILFTTGRFMDVEEIAKLCQIGSTGVVKEILEKLKEEYDKKNGSLMLFNEDNKWKLNIKKEYNYLTTELLTSSEFDEPTTKTLAIIAYRQPVLQSEIIDIRGNGGYEHIKTLRENEFITSERKGRTRMLKLTPKFYDYFDIVENKLMSKFTDVEKQFIMDDNREGDGHAT